jgi:hypothetical protein
MNSIWVNLLFKSLLSSLTRLAEEKGVRNFRVDHRRNRDGDLVVALIIRDRDGPYGPDAVPSTPATSERAARSHR